MLSMAAPASKSVSHRMLMGAALAPGVSEVRHVLMSKDIERTMAILTAAGAHFEPLSSLPSQSPLSPEDGGEGGAFRVTGMAHGPVGAPLEDRSVPPLSCDVHESGTTCRLLTAILAAGRGRFRLHGASRMHQRPVGELTAVLQGLGVGVSFEEQPACPPLVLESSGFQGRAACIGLDESSQYLSGLLLAAPLSEHGLSLTLGGQKVVSWPYIGLTLQALEDFGVPFSVETRPDPTAPWQLTPWRSLHTALPQCARFHVAPAPYQAGNYRVEGDWSGASYFLAAGAVGQKALCITGLRGDSLQGDRALVGILRRMGAHIDVADKVVGNVTVRPSSLHGQTLDMGHCPDLVPTVAVMAAFASGATTVTNVAHLRIKESDRIAAPAAELRKVGVRVDEHEDGLTVHGLGQPPRIPAGTAFQAHGDHRIAMSTALLGLHGDKVLLDDPTVVRKSFPHFWTLWDKVRA